MYNQNQNRVNCDQVATKLAETDQEADNQTFTILQWIWDNGCTEPEVPPSRPKRQAPGPGPAPGPAPGGDSMGPPGETPVFLESEYTFLAQFMTLNETLRRSIGHQFESFIKSCTFRGKDCLNNRYEVTPADLL